MVHFVTWLSNQVGEGKSTCLLRFRFVSRKDVRSSSRYFQQSNACRIIWNRRRTLRVRVGYFQGLTTNFADSEKIPEKLDACRSSPEEFEDRMIFMSEKFSRMSLEFRKRSRIAQKRFPRGTLVFSSVQEKKTNGVERTPTNLKGVECYCWCHGGKFFKKVEIRFSQVSVRWVEGSWKGKVEDVRSTSMRNLRVQSSYFARFTQQSSSENTEQQQVGLIPGQTHVFIETSVAKANGQLTQKLEAQDGDSLVQTPRRNDEAAGNRLRMYLQNFEEFSYEVQFTKASRSVGIMRRVAVDVYDGFEGKTGFREYTKPREDPGSEIIDWMDQWTNKNSFTSPSQNYMLPGHILSRKKIPSTSGGGSTSLVIWSRGSNRYVEVLQYNDPGCSPNKRMNQRIV